MNRIKIFRRILEYLGILRVIIDIGNEEIRFIEAIRFFKIFKIITVRSEKQYDSARFAFILERFLEKNASHKIKRINLTLSSTSIIPLYLTFPGIPRDKIESAILWEMERNIPLSIDEAYYTYKIVSQLFENGVTVWNVLAVISKKDEVDKYIQTFKDLGIIVEDVSYLPINILSTLDVGTTDNSIGYVYITQHAIELYVLLKKKIISFAHYIGNFDNINKITIHNIVDYFADFIQRRVSFLERIVVINQTEGSDGSVAETLLDSLNIITLPATKTDFLPVFQVEGMDENIYDLLGFSYKSYLNLPISSQQVKKLHIRDVVIRIVVVLLIILNVFSISFYPVILAANQKYSIVKRAKTTKADQIKNPKVKEMAEDLFMIDKITTLKARQNELMTKIEDIKNSGVQSSNLKLIIAELSRLIPDDVWIKSLSLDNDKGIMKGYSSSSSGLEQFIVYMVNSKTLKDVVLKDADFNKLNSSSQLEFTIEFGVRQ